MLAKRGDRSIFQFGTAGNETRRHQLNLATIRSDSDKPVLRMRGKILKIRQPAKRNAGRSQLFDDGFSRRTAEYAGYDVFQRIAIATRLLLESNRSSVAIPASPSTSAQSRAHSRSFWIEISTALPSPQL